MINFEIKDLTVSTEKKELLSLISLKLEKGKIYVLIGPNGAGKTTLAQTIMGNPKYKIEKGSIIFNKKDLINLKPDQRAKLGIFVSFQNSFEIGGISFSKFLRTAYNAINQKNISVVEFDNFIKDKLKLLKLNPSFLEKGLNKGLSGGEKKKSELLQMLLLDPKLVVLDEIDSGLDIDSLKDVASAIKKFHNKEKTILIITHYKRIINYIDVEKVFVIDKGRIVLEGKKELLNQLEEKGYSFLKDEKI